MSAVTCNLVEGFDENKVIIKRLRNAKNKTRQVKRDLKRIYPSWRAFQNEFKDLIISSSNYALGRYRHFMFHDGLALTCHGQGSTNLLGKSQKLAAVYWEVRNNDYKFPLLSLVCVLII